MRSRQGQGDEQPSKLPRSPLSTVVALMTKVSVRDWQSERGLVDSGRFRAMARSGSRRSSERRDPTARAPHQEASGAGRCGKRVDGEPSPR